MLLVALAVLMPGRGWAGTSPDVGANAPTITATAAALSREATSCARADSFAAPLPVGTQLMLIVAPDAWERWALIAPEFESITARGPPLESEKSHSRDLTVFVEMYVVGDASNSLVCRGVAHVPVTMLREGIHFGVMDTWGGINKFPITLHRFIYTNDNPISCTDPTGRLTLGETVIVVSVALLVIGLPIQWYINSIPGTVKDLKGVSSFDMNAMALRIEGGRKIIEKVVASGKYSNFKEFNEQVHEGGAVSGGVNDGMFWGEVHIVAGDTPGTIKIKALFESRTFNNRYSWPHPRAVDDSQNAVYANWWAEAEIGRENILVELLRAEIARRETEGVK